MDTPRAFTLAVDPALPTDEREALLDAFASNGVSLRETQARDPVSAWLVFLGIIGGVKAVADTGAAVLALYEAIKKWRADSRATGVTPAARLEAPGRPPLDLATASDDTLLAWLLQSQQ